TSGGRRCCAWSGGWDACRDRDREHLHGVILTDDIVVKNFAYLLGGRNGVVRLHRRGFILLADDVHAQLDALVADENGRAGDETCAPRAGSCRRMCNGAVSWFRRCRAIQRRYTPAIRFSRLVTTK